MLLLRMVLSSYLYKSCAKCSFSRTSNILPFSPCNFLNIFWVTSPNWKFCFTQILTFSPIYYLQLNLKINHTDLNYRGWIETTVTWKKFDIRNLMKEIGCTVMMQVSLAHTHGWLIVLSAPKWTEREYWINPT